MPAHVANVVFIALILGLFWLDRDREVRPSKALWIPSVWLLINASRTFSQWLAAFGWHVDGPTNITDAYSEGNPFDRDFFTVLLLAGLFVLYKRRRHAVRLLRVNVPILIYFFYCGVSMVWSGDPFVTLKHWTKGIADVVMVLVILTETDVTAAMKVLLARMSFILLPLSVLFIKYYPDLGREYRTWVWTPMYSGVTMFKNLLGMTCMVCGLGTLWRFLGALQENRKKLRHRQLLAHGLVLLILIWLFHMADSMTSLSCFLLAGSMMTAAFLFRFARKPLALQLMMVGAVALPLFALFSGAGGGMVGSMGRDPTLTGRTAIWQAVLSVSGNPFVGTGYESFWLGDRMQRVWVLFGLDIQEAHNGYLEVYLNIGWIGICLLAMLIATGYRNVLRAVRQDYYTGAIKAAFFVSCVIYSLTEAGFRMMAPTWIVFVLGTFAIPQNDSAQRAPVLGADEGSSATDREPQFDHVLNFGINEAAH